MHENFGSECFEKFKCHVPVQNMFSYHAILWRHAEFDVQHAHALLEVRQSIDIHVVRFANANANLCLLEHDVDLRLTTLNVIHVDQNAYKFIF